MCPKGADGMANSVDPDQTAPLGAVWSGSTLFAQNCLSENLGKLRYAYFAAGGKKSSNEPCHDKTCLWGLQLGKTQTSLLS